ncbi:hypothetical protein QCD79_31345, partial [Pseudomonas quasicaspiana]|nr:hypothetical protein [Pseudomonas quasicaspiana]
FQYSPVEGAPANLLDAAIVPDDVKQDRWDRFMAHQQASSAARLLVRHEAVPAILFDVVRHNGRVQQVGRRALNRRVLE